MMIVIAFVEFEKAEPPGLEDLWPLVVILLVVGKPNLAWIMQERLVHQYNSAFSTVTITKPSCLTRLPRKFYTGNGGL